MKILIVQALCPARHCILSVAGEGEPDHLTALLREAVELAISGNYLNPHCGLCGAPRDTWKYEAGVTEFASMDEARPVLARMEAEQAILRAHMHATGRAYDAQQGKG